MYGMGGISRITSGMFTSGTACVVPEFTLIPVDTIVLA
jgi:hypothetical protein